MPQTSPSLHPTWDFFADEVLPVIGFASLHYVLQLNCPMLAPDRVDHWASRFKVANDELESGFGDEPDGLTEEERDGLWYDQMKSIALECLSEIEQILGRDSNDMPRPVPG